MADCARCEHPDDDHEDGVCRADTGMQNGSICTCPMFLTRLPRPPIRGARLNANYCLVKLTYLQAQQLFLAADPHRHDRDNGWKDIERKALREALDKLSETAGRWPQGMDV